MLLLLIDYHSRRRVPKHILPLAPKYLDMSLECIYSIELPFCARDILFLCARHFVRATFCARDILCARLFVRATFCARDFLCARLFVRATFCARDFLCARLFVRATSAGGFLCARLFVRAIFLFSSTSILLREPKRAEKSRFRRFDVKKARQGLT